MLMLPTLHTTFPQDIVRAMLIPVPLPLPVPLPPHPPFSPQANLYATLQLTGPGVTSTLDGAYRYVVVPVPASLPLLPGQAGLADGQQAALPDAVSLVFACGATGRAPVSVDFQ